MRASLACAIAVLGAGACGGGQTGVGVFGASWEDDGGKSIEEVVVEERTPGICVAVGDRSLFISFEQGTSIEFTPPGARASLPVPGFAAAPDPFPGNRAATPDHGPDLFSGGYMLWVEPSGTVRFMNKAFEPVEDSTKATLLIDAESLEQVAKQHKVLPGLRLPSK